MTFFWIFSLIPRFCHGVPHVLGHMESILGAGWVPHQVNSQPLKSLYQHMALYFNSFIYSPNKYNY